MAQQSVNLPWTTGPGNIRVVWDDADPSPTEVKISSTDVHQEQRSQVITFKSTEYDAEAPLTVNQAATEITYTLTPVLSSDSPIAASGGSITVEKCELKEFHNGVLSGTSEVTPDSITGTADGFTVSENTVTAANRGTVEGDARSIQITCSYLTPRGITAQGTATISQAANNRVIVYGKPTITSFEVADIPASGGSVSSGDVEYSQSRHYYYDSGQTEQLSALTTGGEVTFGDAVSAGSLGITVKDRTIVGQLTCKVTMNGQTSVEGDASVYQQENIFNSWIIEHPSINLPRSGETDITFENLGWTWTAGHFPIRTGQDLDSYQIIAEIESDLIDDVYGGINGNDGTFDFDNVLVVSNETSSPKSEVLYLRITATDTHMFDHTEVIDVTQSAGTQTYSEITVNLSYPQASAAGGTVNPTLTYSQTWGWNGSTTGGGTITSGASISYSGTNVNAYTGTATVASKGTTVSGVTTATTATVTVSMNGKTAKKSVAVQQAANAITSSEYQDAVITVSPDVKQIAATGETFSLSYTATEAVVNTYTSGDTDSTTSPLSEVLYDNSAAWVHVVDNEDGTYSITVDANTSTTSRSASVMVYSNSGHTGVRASDALSIQQAAAE